MAHGTYAHKLIAGTAAILAWSSVSWRTFETLDRPGPTIIVTLLLCGIVLRLVRPYYSRDSASSSSSKEERQGLPAILDDEFAHKSGLEGLEPRKLGHVPSLDPRSRRRVFWLVVGCIVLRAMMLSRGGQHIECTTKNLEIMLVPLLLVIYESIAIEDSRDTRDEYDIMWANPFMDIYLSITLFRARFLPPTFLLCAGLYVTSIGILPSTYVCSTERREVYSIALLQGLGAVLDFILLVCSWRLFVDRDGQKHTLGVFSTIALYSAILLTILGIPSMLHTSGNPIWLPNLSMPSMWSVLKDGTTLAIGLLCLIYLLSEIRPLLVIIVCTFAWVYAPLVQTAWTNFGPFPPSSKRADFFGLLFLSMGFITFMQISSSSERSSSARNFAKHVPTWFYVLLTISLIVAEGLYLFKPTNVNVHPIDSLMYSARTDGDRWRVNAFSSMSLEAAVAEYRSRYRGRAPPPHFDKWYEFAKERGCRVIDNYDQIYRDLLPFWAIPPLTIRERTVQPFPLNDILAIRIRDGHLEIPSSSDLDKDGKPNETIDIIKQFAKWLPDMSVVFNLGDLPRVPVPWKQIDNLRKHASSMTSDTQLGNEQGFTTGGEPSTKEPIAIETDYPASDSYKNTHQNIQRFVDLLSYPSIFQNHVAQSCPPYSLARLSRAWHAQGFCVSCASPHSEGQFLDNWTSSGDLCHQPDMANLDGFLMSPGTPPGTSITDDRLVPIFSRSKISGYHDILFPAPGDYIDLSEPTLDEKIFSEMSNTLLWRGPAENNMSALQAWRGKTSHRLTHLAHDTSSTKPIVILLPANDAENFVYEKVPAGQVAGFLDLDVGITECELCGTKEYFEQKRVLGTKSLVNEEEHLNHRYPFVPDGAGASSRFVSFLASNALPFRSSIFRSWYDDRLQPWLHYVPIDSRLQAVHSTLAYFTGLKGKINGRDIDMPDRFRDAKFIADQGRKWAETALRREDAEVYLFRLLLEYGRLVDDRRDEIGFGLEN